MPNNFFIFWPKYAPPFAWKWKGRTKKRRSSKTSYNAESVVAQRSMKTESEKVEYHGTMWISRMRNKRYRLFAFCGASVFPAWVVRLTSLVSHNWMRSAISFFQGIWERPQIRNSYEVIYIFKLTIHYKHLFIINLRIISWSMY